MKIFKRSGEYANFSGHFAGYMFENGICAIRDDDQQAIAVARNLLVRFNGCEEVGEQVENLAEVAQDTTEGDEPAAEGAETQEAQPAGRKPKGKK